jgi:hypothetical protein
MQGKSFDLGKDLQHQAAYFIRHRMFIADRGCRHLFQGIARTSMCNRRLIKTDAATLRIRKLMTRA